MPQFEQLPDEILERILQVLFDETSDPTVSQNEYPIGDSNEKPFLESTSLNHRLYDMGESVICHRAFVKVANDIDDVVESRYGSYPVDAVNRTVPVFIWSSNISSIIRKKRTHVVQKVILKLCDHPDPTTVMKALTAAGLFSQQWKSIRSIVIDYRGVFRDTSTLYPENLCMRLTSRLLHALPNVVNIRYEGHAREHYIKRMLYRFVHGCTHPLQGVSIATTEFSQLSIGAFRPGLTTLHIAAYLGIGALELPKIYASTLVDLSIAGLHPADFWSRFYTDTDGVTLEFPCLVRMDLNFSSPRATVPLGRSMLKHTLFPKLYSLTINNYKFNINSILSIFPREQIGELKVMEKAEGGQVDIEPFTKLYRLVLNDWHNKELERMSTMPQFVHPMLDVATGLRELTLFTLRVCNIQALQSRGLDSLRYLHLLCFDRLGTIDELATIDDFIYGGKHWPIHSGIKRLDITGYQPEVDDSEALVEQLVCFMAGLPALECVSLNGFQDHYTHAIREHITMHLHDGQIGPHIEHLRDVYIQEIIENSI